MEVTLKRKDVRENEGLRTAPWGTPTIKRGEKRSRRRQRTARKWEVGC